MMYLLCVCVCVCVAEEEREQVERLRWPSRGYLQELSEYQQRRRKLRKSRCIVMWPTWMPKICENKGGRAERGDQGRNDDREWDRIINPERNRRRKCFFLSGWFWMTLLGKVTRLPNQWDNAAQQWHTPLWHTPLSPGGMTAHPLHNVVSIIGNTKWVIFKLDINLKWLAGYRPEAEWRIVLLSSDEKWRISKMNSDTQWLNQQNRYIKRPDVCWNTDQDHGLTVLNYSDG